MIIKVMNDAPALIALDEAAALPMIACVHRWFYSRRGRPNGKRGLPQKGRCWNTDRAWIAPSMKQSTLDSYDGAGEQVRDESGKFVSPNGEHPWRDAERLREMYHTRTLSTFEIADRWGCSQAVIHKWLDRHGIETRDTSEATTLGQLKGPDVPHFWDGKGYECISSGFQGEEDRVRVHRLIAAAKFGLDAMEEMVVHHRNGMKFDNRPENLELMEQGEHARYHNYESLGSEPWHDEETLKEMYVEQDMRVSEMASELGCSKTTVYNWLRRYSLVWHDCP